LHERQHNSPPRLACSKRNLTTLEIDRTPCKFRQVAETLSEVESEKHKAASFGILAARFQNALDFRECERAPCGFVVRFEDWHAHSRIHREQTLPDSLAKADAGRIPISSKTRPIDFFASQSDET
jgi:hypothetical protein